MVIKMRTAEEIVNQTNDLARAIYKLLGYVVDVEHKFYEFDRVNYHAHERICCEAQCLLTSTDPQDALDELEG